MDPKRALGELQRREYADAAQHKASPPRRMPKSWSLSASMAPSPGLASRRWVWPSRAPSAAQASSRPQPLGTHLGSDAQELGRRLGKQCRERWFNHLDPDLNKGPFTAEEDEQILSMKFTVGSKWAAIATALEGRTDNMVKNRYNSTLKRVMDSLKPALLSEGIIAADTADADVGKACLQRMKEQGLLGPEINKLKTRPAGHKATTRHFSSSRSGSPDSSPASPAPNSASVSTQGGKGKRGPKAAPRPQGTSKVSASQAISAAAAAAAAANSGAPRTVQGFWPGALGQPGASAAMAAFGSPPGTANQMAAAQARAAALSLISPPHLQAAQIMAMMASRPAGQSTALATAQAAALPSSRSKGHTTAPSRGTFDQGPPPASNKSRGAPLVPFALTRAQSMSAASNGSDHDPAPTGLRAVPDASGGVVEKPTASRPPPSGSEAATPPNARRSGAGHAQRPPASGDSASTAFSDDATAQSAAYLASLHPDMQGRGCEVALGRVFDEVVMEGSTAPAAPGSTHRSTAAPMSASAQHGIFSPHTPKVGISHGASGRGTVERGTAERAPSRGDGVPLTLGDTPAAMAPLPLAPAVASSGEAGVGIAMRRAARRGPLAAGQAPAPPLPPAGPTARGGGRLPRASSRGGVRPPRTSSASVPPPPAPGPGPGMAPSPGSVGGGVMTPLSVVTPNTAAALVAQRSSTTKAGRAGGVKPSLRQQRVRPAVTRLGLTGGDESPSTGRVLVYSSEEEAGSPPRTGGHKRALAPPSLSDAKRGRAL